MAKWLILCVLLWAGTACAQDYVDYPVTTEATVDTMIGNAADTSEAINLYYKDTQARPVDPTFYFYRTDIGSNTKLDSLFCELYIAEHEDADNPTTGKASAYWFFVKRYNTYSLGCGVLAANEPWVIVADTLNYLTAKYARWVISSANTGGGLAADSMAWRTVFHGERGGNP